MPIFSLNKHSCTTWNITFLIVVSSCAVDNDNVWISSRAWSKGWKLSLCKLSNSLCLKWTCDKLTKSLAYISTFLVFQILENLDGVVDVTLWYEVIPGTSEGQVHSTADSSESVWELFDFVKILASLHHAWWLHQNTLAVCE